MTWFLPALEDAIKWIQEREKILQSYLVLEPVNKSINEEATKEKKVLGYGLIQEAQNIQKMNKNAIVDKVTLSKGENTGDSHKTKIVFESEAAKKLYETNPQFRHKIDEMAKSMPGKVIYVKLEEYQHGHKITTTTTKTPDNDLWKEHLDWLNKNDKEEILLVAALVIVLVVIVLFR